MRPNSHPFRVVMGLENSSGPWVSGSQEKRERKGQPSREMARRKQIEERKNRCPLLSESQMLVLLFPAHLKSWECAFPAQSGNSNAWFPALGSLGQVSPEIASGPLSKGTPTPGPGSPWNPPALYLPHLSTLSMLQPSHHSISQREKELGGVGGWDGGGGSRGWEGGIAARPLGLGWWEARKHLFLLSSAPVAPRRSGWAQEPPQASLFRPGSSIRGRGVGRRSLAWPLGFWRQVLTLFSHYPSFPGHTTYPHCFSPHLSGNQISSTQISRTRLPPNCVCVCWLSLPGQQSAIF